MKNWLHISAGLLICFSTAPLFYKPAFNLTSPNATPPVVFGDFTVSETALLQQKAHEIKTFAAANGYHTQLAILINLKKHSGDNRFFVYNLKTNTVLHKGLVTHGRCNQQWLQGRKYSNEPGCGCSSLGKYKIGLAYYGRFGLAYKLHGLDSSNSNAYKRFVVLHSHPCVPETVTLPEPICQSDGCPTVSPQLLQQVKPLLKNCKKPVLLWMYEE